MEEKLYVQYGCGFSAPKRWRNFDTSPTLRFEKIPVLGKLYTKNKTRFPENVEYGDIIKGLPIPPGSCQGVYASHVLEHMALDDFRIALRNTFLMLRLGGIFRLVVPDLEILAKSYIDSDDPMAAEKFMRATSLGIDKRSRTFGRFLSSWLGNSVHLWMWDFKSLQHELSAVGFVDIHQCAYGDSEDPMFKDVEDPNRFVDSVAVECRKT